VLIAEPQSTAEFPRTVPDAAEALPARRRWLTAGGVFFIALWLVLLVAGREKLFRDPGTFWHLVLGERLLTTGQFTTHDDFTFTFAGQPWLSLQWLGEAAMALAYRAGGWDGLLLLVATTLAATYAFLVGRLIRAGLHWLPATVIVVVVIAASSHHFHARPHLATIAFMGLTVAWLCDIEAGRASLARLAWLAPIFVFWTNLHGGVLGGLATVVFVAIGWLLIGALRRGPLRHPTHVLFLATFVLLLGSTLLVNPYGLAMPRAWLTIMAMPLPDLIQEHRPLSALRPEGVMIGLLAAAYVWLLVDTLLRDPRRLPNPQSAIRNPQSPALRITWLLPLLWLPLAILRVRHAPLFAMTAGIALADMLPHTRLAAWLAKWDLFRQALRDTPSRPAIWRWAAPPSLLVLLALGAQLSGTYCPLIGRGWARLDAALWPVELVPQLRQIEQESPGARILNTLNYGGFLTLHAPGLKTFIDDRCELFGTQFLASYAEAEQSKAGRVMAWTFEHDVDFALVPANSLFASYLSSSVYGKSWSEEQRTPTAVLYRRCGDRD
jgi:hypothetical protein